MPAPRPARSLLAFRRPGRHRLDNRRRRFTITAGVLTPLVAVAAVANAGMNAGRRTG